MLRKLLVLAGAGFAAKKLTDRKRSTANVGAMDRKMHRKGMPGNVRP